MIAVWLFSQWLGAGSPESLRLVELGPGRGTLMADILHTFKQLFTSRKVNPNVEIHLVENSETLRGLQRQKLSDFGHELQWHDSINTISKSTTQYTMLVAHEFFDALPVHILMKSEQGWRELQVGSSEIVSEAYLESWYKLQVACKNERPHLLSFFHAEPTPVATVLGNSSPRFSTVSKGAHLEVSPAAFKIAYKVGELLSRKESEDDVQGLGGCGLIIDYGSSDPPLNTIRAFKDHKQVHPLHRPGECDLTGNVDFGYLKEAMQDLVPVYPPIEQGVFLQHMGLSSRLRSLARNSAGLSAEEAQERYSRLLQGATRLADPREMGSQYKFLGISSNPNTEDGAHVYPFGIGAEGTGDEVTSQPRARD
ncbi:hypothetical protein VKT23_009121 [Stygiomarasmius scandens]|uniref:Protein arginine methyltransferase NDUFAF7 n=1 Tax=Marasmiellus scandens TaxID=2682957 RepID=A0ABR1JH20_9AGAR